MAARDPICRICASGEPGIPEHCMCGDHPDLATALSEAQARAERAERERDANHHLAVANGARAKEEHYRADAAEARIAELEAENERYVVWSNEHNAWWRPSSAGYTRHVEAAGIYSRDEALSISRCARDGWEPGRRPDEIPVRVADLPDFARTALGEKP